MKDDKKTETVKRLHLSKESLRAIHVQTRVKTGLRRMEPTTGPSAETYTCGGCSQACA